LFELDKALLKKTKGWGFFFRSFVVGIAPRSRAE
jgi:hypothetical protein